MVRKCHPKYIRNTSVCGFRSQNPVHHSDLESSSTSQTKRVLFLIRMVAAQEGRGVHHGPRADLSWAYHAVMRFVSVAMGKEFLIDLPSAAFRARRAIRP